MPDIYWYPTLIIVALLLLPTALLALPFFGGEGLKALVRVEAKLLSLINLIVGTTVAWLTLAMVLIQFLVVVMRYAYGVNFIALQESVLYAHGIMFTLAAGYTLNKDGHVRVDIFYQNMSPKGQALVNFAGTYLFLVPFMLTVLYFSWEYVANAWRITEGSRESSGLAYLYLLKTVLLVFAGLVLAQGIALAGQSALILSRSEQGASNDAG